MVEAFNDLFLNRRQAAHRMMRILPVSWEKEKPSSFNGSPRRPSARLFPPSSALASRIEVNLKGLYCKFSLSLWRFK